MCCCGNTSPTVTFGWLGGLVANFAFVGLIAWGAATNWAVGFVFSGLYTAGLFWLSAYLKRNFKVDGLTLATDVLIMVAVFGVGVTTLFLPMNLIGCGSDASFDTGLTGEFNNADVPPPLADWATRDLYSLQQYDSPTFAQLNGSVIFSGSNGTNNGWPRTLLVARGGSGTSQIVDVIDASIQDPVNFVNAADHVCFIGRRDSSSFDGSFPRLMCTSDGEDVKTLNIVGNTAINSPSAVVAHGGLVYLKGAHASNTETPRNGLIFVADPTENTIRLLPASNASSTDTNSETSGDKDCDRITSTQNVAIATLFITSLPLLAVAVFVAARWKIASMAVAIFAAASIVVVNLYVIADPRVPGMQLLLKWWFSVFSSLWLAVCLIFYLSNRVLTKSGLAWAMNIGGVFYFGAMHAQLEIPFQDDAWRWVVYQFVAVLPLGGMGITTDNTLLLLLSAMGIVIDVYRLSTFLVDLTTDGTAQILIRFGILAVSGMGIVFCGFKYQQMRPKIQRGVETFARRSCQCIHLEKQIAGIKVANIVEMTEVRDQTLKTEEGGGGVAAAKV